MSTNITAADRPSPNNTRYTDVGTQFETERKNHADKAGMALIIAWITTIVGTFFDYQIYKPIADRIVYTNSNFSNQVTCLFLSAAPIGAAWILAKLMSMIMNKASRRTWHIAVFALVFIFTAGLLAVTCWLRLSGAGSDASSDKITYAWAINVLAILIAVMAFVIHLILCIKREKHRNLAEKARIQRDFTEDSGEGIRFANTSDVDTQRETNDHCSWCNAYDALAELALDLMELSRDVNARLYATTAELLAQVKAFPYRVRGVAYDDRAEAKTALLDAFGAPGRSPAHHNYGPPQNRLLDGNAQKTIEDLNARYRNIINGQSDSSNL